MSLHLKKITDKIILVSSSNQEELARTFLRFQEHYESPKFRNQIFTIGQFRQYYSETFGAFTYFQDWTGFNIPGSVLKPFSEGLFDPLTESEHSLLKLFQDRRDDFYIIGTNDPSAIEHEICHGLYGTEPSYCDQALSIVYEYNHALDNLKDFILDKGYHKDVLVDEIQAYVSADYDWLRTEKNIVVPEEMHKELRELRKRFPTNEVVL